MQYDVDLVVTFVDSNDPVWMEQILKYNSEFRPKRYRSWDTFKYWFRCVERNMKFIRKIHLVVSNIEQVPEWLDQSKVNIVLHEDIIPKEFLPTFNSTTIELFLWRIPGLSERFIYSNDDMFAVNECSRGDFFTDDGLPIYDVFEKTTVPSMFRFQAKNCFTLAKKLSGTRFENPSYYFYIKHGFDPMLKSVCGEMYGKAKGEINRSISKFREPFNFTQYLYPDYSLMTGRGVRGGYSLKYIILYSPNMAAQEILSAEEKVICVNDCRCEDGFEMVKEKIEGAFQKRFPEKCEVEL